MPDSNKTRINCRICGDEGPHHVHIVREMMMGTKERFNYFHCSNCECLQLIDIPDDMSRYYPADYYSFSFGTNGKKSPRNLKNTIKKMKTGYRQFRNRLYFSSAILRKTVSLLYPDPYLEIISKTGISRKSPVLDVGCGSGSALDFLKKSGLTDLTGIDPFIKEDITSNGISVLKKHIHEMQGSFNLVMFNHSLEHMPDQFSTLEQAGRLLSANGKCLVRIPTVSSYAWKHYGTDWVSLDAPRHVFLHSHKSFRLLAEKVGLSIKRMSCDSTEFQFWGSEQYENNIPLNSEKSFSVSQKNSIFTKKKIRNFRKKARILNKKLLGDQIAVIMERST